MISAVMVLPPASKIHLGQTISALAALTFGAWNCLLGRAVLETERHLDGITFGLALFGLQFSQSFNNHNFAIF